MAPRFGNEVSTGFDSQVPYHIKVATYEADTTLPTGADTVICREVAWGLTSPTYFIMFKSKVEAIRTLKEIQATRKMDLHDIKRFVEDVMTLGVEEHKKDVFVKESLALLEKLK